MDSLQSGIQEGSEAWIEGTGRVAAAEGQVQSSVLIVVNQTKNPGMPFDGVGEKGAEDVEAGAVVDLGLLIGDAQINDAIFVQVAPGNGDRHFTG